MASSSVSQVSRRELRFAGAAKVRGIRPVGDRVLVRRVTEPDPPRDVIWTPEADARKTQVGSVVAVGAGVLVGSGTVQPGDRIVLPARAGGGLVLRLDGQDHLIVRARDILARFEIV
jgi:chaperonin GroES